MVMMRLVLLVLLLIGAPLAWAQTQLAPGTYTLPPGASIHVPDPTPPPGDTTPPEISGLTVSDITETGAVVTFQTNETATGVVDVGPTTAYDLISVPTPAGTSHTVTLAGLTANTTYHVRVTATDAAGNQGVSPDATFQTAQAPPPTHALTITTIGEGSGTVTGEGDYPEGAVVTLTATPASGSTFTAYGGDADCADGSVTMTGPVSCTASFALVPALPPPPPASNLADLGDNSWFNPQPAMRATYQSLSPAPPRMPGTLTASAPSGTGVTFTASQDVFGAEHVGRGIGTGNLAWAAIITQVNGPREVVGDVVLGSWGTATIWTMTEQPVSEFLKDCTRTIQHNGPTNRSYSGVVYGGGVLFDWGGGHGTEPGNHIDLYRIALNLWEAQAPPQCPMWPDINWVGVGTFSNDIAPARDLPDFKSPDGEPYTMHSYQNFVYDPPRNRFVWIAGGGTWAYDLTTRTLRRLAGPGTGKPSPISMSGVGVNYEPESDRILAWLGGPQKGSGFSTRGVYAMTPDGDWSLLSTTTPPLHGRQIFVKHDPHTNTHGIVFTPTSSNEIPREFWLHHVPSNTWTKIASYPAELSAIGRIVSHDFDSVNRRWVFLRGKEEGQSTARLWAWNPAAGDVPAAWESLGSGIMPADVDVNGTDRGEFAYDPINNVFWVVDGKSTYCGIPRVRCGGKAETYAYRYKKAGGTPPPDPDPEPEPDPDPPPDPDPDPEPEPPPPTSGLPVEPVTTKIVDATSGATIQGVVERVSLEGDWTRVDWSYADLLLGTTRLRCAQDGATCEAVHTLRNSSQFSERHVKLRSATLTVGTGSALRAARLWDRVVAPRAGATVELLPETVARWSGGPDGGIDVTANGGLLLPDMTTFTQRVCLGCPAADPVPPATPLPEYGTVADEEAYWLSLGRTPDPSDYPNLGPDPGYQVTANDVSNKHDLEADDCWQWLVMYLRSGAVGYWHRARAYCQYHIDQMIPRTYGYPYAWDGDRESDTAAVERPRVVIPLTAVDEAYLRGYTAYGSDLGPGRLDASHSWGWGLLLWHRVTGDPEALLALEDAVEVIARRNYRLGNGTSSGDPGTSGRTGARNWWVTIAACEAGIPVGCEWAERFARAFEASASWDATRGAYLLTDSIAQAGGFKWINPHHFAHVVDAHEQWVRVRPTETWARDRVVAMAEFIRRDGLHPVYLQSDKSIRIYDADGRPEYPLFDVKSLPSAIFNPYHTCALVDALVLGWRHTGDAKYLERAKLHHERCLTHIYRQLVLSPPATPDGAVQSFSCAHPKNLRCDDRGQPQYVGRLFVAWKDAGLPAGQAPTVTLTPSVTQSPYDGAATLTWSAANATACQAGGHWDGARPPAGQETVSPLKTRRGYVLTCMNDLGAGTRFARIDVGAAPARNADPATTLVYYSLDADEIDGETVIDRSGHGRNGALFRAEQDGDTLRLPGGGWVRDLKVLEPGPRWAATVRFKPDPAGQGGNGGTLFNLGRIGYPYAVQALVSTDGHLVTRIYDATGTLHEHRMPAPADWTTYRIEVTPGLSRILLDGAEVGTLPTGVGPTGRVPYWGGELAERSYWTFRGWLDEIRVEVLP